MTAVERARENLRRRLMVRLPEPTPDPGWTRADAWEEEHADD